MPGMIPPVQPVGTAVPKVTIASPSQPGGGTQPSVDQGQSQATPENLLLLVGALTEALCAKGVIDEADIHNAISTLEGNEAHDEDGGKEKPPVNRSQPPKDGGSPGYPGGKPSFGAAGDEHGKFGK